MWPISGVATFLGPSFWVVDFIVNIGLVGGVRFLIRAIAEWQTQRSAELAGTGRVPALLYGAGRAGATIARSAMREPKAGVQPVGFLDDDLRRKGQSIAGVPVLGNLNELSRAVAATGAKMLLITMPRASGPVIRHVMEAGVAAGLEVRTIPPFLDLIDGTIDAFRVRRVRVEDLLGRTVASDHAEGVDDLIRDKVVMITGAGGSIGSELARQVQALRPRELVLVDRAESPLYTIERDLDVRGLQLRGGGRIDDLPGQRGQPRPDGPPRRQRAQPDIIFHAAAYKHVPMMEELPLGGRPGQHRRHPLDARCRDRGRRPALRARLHRQGRRADAA